MQTGENVANWREKLNNKLQSEDRFNTTEPNKYSGYVYDAVWLYALALDKLIKLNQSYIQAQYIYYDSKFLASLWPHFARTYLQLPLLQWGFRNVYLLVLSSWKVNNAENTIAVMGL